ncbi:hypothetical protein AB205_0140470 [Aquarana catesbeiana]|uniref:Uncharacterized protein n=1 Tax=Aquarana catesbeiana TaxID=8400 RepID=A0A2G9R5G4_AQUCT|nr:hypothetical protein AB205_0140470 [Aquarana catesbeiana]
MTHACYALYTLRMRETPPAPDLLSMGEHMAETEQVYESSSFDEESPEPQKSRSRRFKASNMSFGEMVEMVDILKRADYDGKYGPYRNPNVRKAKIMTKVVKSLQKNFGVWRSKNQLRKRWSDHLKLREQDQYRRIKRVLQKSKYFVVFSYYYYYFSAAPCAFLYCTV